MEELLILIAAGVALYPITAFVLRQFRIRDFAAYAVALLLHCSVGYIVDFLFQWLSAHAGHFDPGRRFGAMMVVHLTASALYQLVGAAGRYKTGYRTRSS
jgi:hypothetical protein